MKKLKDYNKLILKLNQKKMKNLKILDNNQKKN